MPILMEAPTIPRTPCFTFPWKAEKVFHGVCGLLRECLTGVSRFHSAAAWKYTERFMTRGRTHVGSSTNGRNM